MVPGAVTVRARRQNAGMPERNAAHRTRYSGEQGARRARPVLIDALIYAGPGLDRLAVDLGCGVGIETRLLIAAEWTVHALDADEPSLHRLRSTIAPVACSRSNSCVVDLNDLPELPRADVIYAGYALPFARPDRFQTMWSTMTRASMPEAMLAVNLFADRDSGANRERETYVTEVEVRKLLDGLAFSGPKHWHVFDRIARRPATTPHPGFT